VRARFGKAIAALPPETMKVNVLQRHRGLQVEQRHPITTTYTDLLERTSAYLVTVRAGRNVEMDRNVTAPRCTGKCSPHIAPVSWAATSSWRRKSIQHERGG